MPATSTWRADITCLHDGARGARRSLMLLSLLVSAHGFSGPYRQAAQPAPQNLAGGMCQPGAPCLMETSDGQNVTMTVPLRADGSAGVHLASIHDHHLIATGKGCTDLLHSGLLFLNVTIERHVTDQAQCSLAAGHVRFDTAGMIATFS